MDRRKMLNVLHEAHVCLGSYDDWPVLPAGIDPLPCLSRNRSPQPFYLSSENDWFLAAMSGTAMLRLPGAPNPVLDIRLGELVYVPAGQACRIVPEHETILLRYRAEMAGWEAAIWFCEQCEAEVHRREFDNVAALPQENYWSAAQEFNGDSSLRTCGTCGFVNPACDLSDIRWPEVAAEIRANDQIAKERAAQREQRQARRSSAPSPA